MPCPTITQASDVSINTRERLKRYDPGLAEMMCKVRCVTCASCKLQAA